MAKRKKPSDSPDDDQNPEQNGPTDNACRPTFYMDAELLAAFEAQCKAEGDRKRSPFLSELLTLLLTSPTGQELRELAKQNRRGLAHELESQLILFNKSVPKERIAELAEASQRNPDQMLVRLLLLGLQVYERSIERMNEDIQNSQGIL